MFLLVCLFVCLFNFPCPLADNARRYCTRIRRRRRRFRDRQGRKGIGLNPRQRPRNLNEPKTDPKTCSNFCKRLLRFIFLPRRHYPRPVKCIIMYIIYVHSVTQKGAGRLVGRFPRIVDVRTGSIQYSSTVTLGFPATRAGRETGTEKFAAKPALFCKISLYFYNNDIYL